MRGQSGFFEVDDRLKELSAKGDALERLNAVVDFELFRADLARAVPRSDRSKGGRPPFDHVLMFKTRVLQASHSLSPDPKHALPGLDPGIQSASLWLASPAGRCAAAVEPDPRPRLRRLCLRLARWRPDQRSDGTAVEKFNCSRAANGVIAR
jgi:hypothetical protein